MAYIAALTSKPLVHPARMIRLKNRRTSIRLEPEFWDALYAAAVAEGISPGEIVDRAQKRYKGYSMTSAIRVFLLKNIAQRQK